MTGLYEKLGFTLTPRAHHPFGTSNHLAQLGSSFIELLSITKPENITKSEPGVFSFGGYNRAFSRRGDGFSMLALKSNGWKSDREHFISCGLDIYDPFEFHRLAKQPDGSEIRVGFKLTFATHPEMPWAIFFTCDHQHEPKYFYKPQFQSHANTAIDIAEVMMVASDPGIYTSYFESLIGKGSVAEHDSSLSVHAGNSVINIFRHSDLYERFLGALNIGDGETQMIGYGIYVQNINAIENIMQVNGLNFQKRGKSLWLSGPETANVILEFSESYVVDTP
jgi:hypothetical protein